MFDSNSDEASYGLVNVSCSGQRRWPCGAWRRKVRNRRRATVRTLRGALSVLGTSGCLHCVPLSLGMSASTYGRRHHLFGRTTPAWRVLIAIIHSCRRYVRLTTLARWGRRGEVMWSFDSAKITRCAPSSSSSVALVSGRPGPVEKDEIMLTCGRAGVTSSRRRCRGGGNG